MNYPQTYDYQGEQVTIYKREQTRFNDQRCYKVECSGEVEAWFGDPQHAKEAGMEYLAILDLQELPNGHWIAHYLLDTRDFPQIAAELDRLGEWR